MDVSKNSTEHGLSGLTHMVSFQNGGANGIARLVGSSLARVALSKATLMMGDLMVGQSSKGRSGDACGVEGGSRLKGMDGASRPV